MNLSVGCLTHAMLLLRHGRTVVAVQDPLHVFFMRNTQRGCAPQPTMNMYDVGIGKKVEEEELYFLPMETYRYT